MLRNFLLVGMGGALGSMLRYAITVSMGTRSFPVATLLINIFGSLAIGMIAAVAVRNVHFEQQWRVLLAVGLCGGFTTFSAFSLENMQLLQNGKLTTALLYSLVSVTSGITAAWAGYRVLA